MKLKSSDSTLINALRILARDVESEDGIANAMLQEAAERLAELVLESRWISVKDQLPEPDVEVLVIWGDKHHPEVAWLNINNKEWESMASLCVYQITHWMPLPPLPD